MKKDEVGKKAVEILQKMLDIVNSGQEVILQRDFGGNTLTMFWGEHDNDNWQHIHVGTPTETFEQLIHHFHGAIEDL